MLFQFNCSRSWHLLLCSFHSIFPILLEVDTSPTYLLFQTLLPLFWTLTCMIWMELTRTDVVFSKAVVVLFLCRNKSSRNDLKINEELFWKIEKIYAERSMPGGPHPVHEGGVRPLPLGVPPASWAPCCSTDVHPESIYSLSGRKKSKRKNYRVSW